MKSESEPRNIFVLRFQATLTMPRNSFVAISTNVRKRQKFVLKSAITRKEDTFAAAISVGVNTEHIANPSIQQCIQPSLSVRPNRIIGT